MRQVVLAAVALLMACVASASHLETVFSVSMPNTETYGGDAYPFADAIYVVCGTFGGVVQAVNLTTRTNLWTSPNYTASFGQIYAVVGTSQAVLLSFGAVIVALSPQSGQQLWSQTGYSLQQLPTAFAYGGTIYAQVILPSGYYALQAFDVATGAPGYFQYGNDLQIDDNTAFVGQYSLNEQGEIVNSYLRAIDIPTNTTLWMVRCSDQAPGRIIPAMNSEYVAISNISGSDEIAVVLHRKNGSVAQTFQAFNGFADRGVATLHGNALLALVGLQFPRYVLADLTTGYITWTRSVNEIGYGGVFSGTALVTVSQSLVLTITPVGSSSPSISIPQVPSLPVPTVVDFGYGVVQVGNLQGYTLWDTNTGDFVGSNEQDPNVGLSAPPKWNGLTIVVSGNVVSAVKVFA